MAIGRFKTAVQHAETSVGNTGAATVESFSFLETDVGARTTGGAEQVIQAEASTGDVVTVGTVVKYVNLFIECGPRSTIEADDDRTGWCEYAVLMNKESDNPIPTANLGTKTLGNVCTNMYRNECIWTGAFPMGTLQPNSTQLVIKVPKFKQTICVGDIWRLVLHFRSVSSTSVSTTAVRFIMSAMYKAYT